MHFLVLLRKTMGNNDQQFIPTINNEKELFDYIDVPRKG
jgi:hypothetical protein